jgi:hypothetical protein
MRDSMPKKMFDCFTKLGASINMRARGISYLDILKANNIDKESNRKVSDNLLLVCQK